MLDEMACPSISTQSIPKVFHQLELGTGQSNFYHIHAFSDIDLFSAEGNNLFFYKCLKIDIQLFACVLLNT